METLHLPVRETDSTKEVLVIYDTGCGTTLGENLQAFDTMEGKNDYTEVELASLNGTDRSRKKICKIIFPLQKGKKSCALEIICPSGPLPQPQGQSHKTFSKLRKYWKRGLRFVGDVTFKEQDSRPRILLGIDAMHLMPTDVT